MDNISCGVKGSGIETGPPGRLYLDAYSKEGSRREKRPPKPAAFHIHPALQRGLDLEPPSLQQGLRNVFRILVATRPLAQTRGALVLLGLELELLHCLLKG